jgi:hypothetical protein
MWVGKVRSGMTDNRIDPSEIEEYQCQKCFQTFLALFLYAKHMRDYHDERMAPLMMEGL